MQVALSGRSDVYRMSKDYMFIIIKPPNKAPKVAKIPKRIRDMEKLVNGNIEEMRYKNVLIIYNEKQNDKNLKNNTIFKELSMKGTILITGNDEKNGDVRSLKKREIIYYLNKLNIKQMDFENEK